MILVVFLVVVLQSSQGSICKRSFEETICENFNFDPDLTLNSSTKILAIKRAKGAIVAENFANLELSELLLSKNNISEIEAGVLCPLKLSSLILNVDENFPKLNGNLLKNCESLKKLYINGASIETGSFSSMQNLEIVTINGSTFLEDLSNLTFDGLNKIELLTIRHCKLKNVVKAFENLQKLKFLDLQNDEIEKFNFRNLNQLKVLDLSFNKLEKLNWEEFEGLEQLQVLYLEGNDFIEIDVTEMMKYVPKLERIFLGRRKFSEEERKVVDRKFAKANVTLIWLSG